MFKRTRLGARSRALLAAATVLALTVVGQIPAHAAPPPPTVHIEAGGDGWANAAEVAAGITVTGTYDTTAIPPITDVIVRIVNSSTCDTSAAETTATQTVPAVGGTWQATFHDVATTLSEGAVLCARARTIDSDGVQSAVAFSDNLPVKDTVAPADPAASIDTDPINASNVTSVVVSGTSEAHGGVLVNLTSGATGLAGGGAVPASGSYSFTFDTSSLADGTVTATVRGFDQAGNEAANTATDSALKDVVPPATPGLTISPTLITAANIGSFTATITGETGTTAVVTADDASATTTPVTVSVALTTSPLDVPLNITSLADGTITVTAKLVDAAGNGSGIATATATKDSTAPAAPVIVTPFQGQQMPSQFDVIGTAEPGSTVEVFDVTDPSEPPVSLGTATANDSGSWKLPAAYVASGIKQIYAVATDAVGNVSLPSTTRIFDVDAIRPALTIDSPANLSPYLPGDQLLIEGRATDDRSGVLAIDLHIFNALGVDIAQVEIKNLTCTAGCPIKRAVTWSYQPSLPPGVYTFKAWAIDVTGNRTAQPEQVTVVKLG